jgi:hypothetical protein
MTYMADFALAAFAPFFTQSLSFLVHQRHLETGQGRSSRQTLFGMREIPGDSQIRAKLDATEPDRFDPMFADLVAKLDQCGGLDAMRCLGGHVLIGLDGAEFHCPDKIHCPNCSRRKRGKDKTEYFHTMLAATIVAPSHNRVVPLEPEFILPQDGHDKQDCESRSARRWLAAHGARYARFGAICLGDDLFSRKPICQAVLDVDGHFLFVCKPESHKAIEGFRAGISLRERTDRARNGKKWIIRRYQWLSGVLLAAMSRAQF